MLVPHTGCMTSSTLVTDTSAPVRVRDRARTALRVALPSGRTGDAAAARAERRAQVRADRARRRAIALQFGAYPATRSAAAVLLPGGPGA
jgi:hypothetical protein